MRSTMLKVEYQRKADVRKNGRNEWVRGAGTSAATTLPDRGAEESAGRAEGGTGACEKQHRWLLPHGLAGRSNSAATCGRTCGQQLCNMAFAWCWWADESLETDVGCTRPRNAPQACTGEYTQADATSSNAHAMDLFLMEQQPYD